MYVLEQDVSAQVHSIPVRGHLGDVHLIINFNFVVPDNQDDGGGGGAGFDVGVDDWADVNEDIIC